VVALKVKFELSTLLKKSVKGTPNFAPKEKGWQEAAPAPNSIRNKDLTMTGLIVGERTLRYHCTEPASRIAGALKD
jgi:hypothetical protein